MPTISFFWRGRVSTRSSTIWLAALLYVTAFSFAGSQALRTRLENGARADVYASANDAQYTPLVAKGLVTPGVPFVRNRLTLIAPKNNVALQTLHDLTRPGLKVLFITGYAPSAVLGNDRLEPGMQVITKPFTLNALAARIKTLVNEVEAA